MFICVTGLKCIEIHGVINTAVRSCVTLADIVGLPPENAHGEPFFKLSDTDRSKVSVDWLNLVPKYKPNDGQTKTLDSG